MSPLDDQPDIDPLSPEAMGADSLLRPPARIRSVIIITKEGRA